MMVKDIGWLKEIIKVNSYESDEGKRVFHKDTSILMHWIGQVEQPELTTGQAWEVIAGEYGEDTLINNIDYLQRMGYAVIEKPEIPGFVAEYIEEWKARGLPLFSAMECSYEENDKVARYLFNVTGEIKANRQNLFARAWLDGYTVEEKKYKVEVPDAESKKRKKLICLRKLNKWILDNVK